MWSVAYSPTGRHLISGSDDLTIRIWDAMTGVVVGSPIEGYTSKMKSSSRSSDVQHIVSPSVDETPHVSHSFPPPSIPLSTRSTPMHPSFHMKPDTNGWVRDSEGGLLYWVPPGCRAGLHSPALLTIPTISDIRSVSLDFTDSAFGTSWTHVFKRAQQ